MCNFNGGLATKTVLEICVKRSEKDFKSALKEFVLLELSCMIWTETSCDSLQPNHGYQQLCPHKSGSVLRHIKRRVLWKATEELRMRSSQANAGQCFWNRTFLMRWKERERKNIQRHYSRTSEEVFYSPGSKFGHTMSRIKTIPTSSTSKNLSFQIMKIPQLSLPRNFTISSIAYELPVISFARVYPVSDNPR